MADEFYTIKEIATTFKVTRQSIHNWIRAGKIASIRMGSARRIPAAEVERLRREGTLVHPEETLTPDLAVA